MALSTPLRTPLTSFDAPHEPAGALRAHLLRPRPDAGARQVAPYFDRITAPRPATRQAGVLAFVLAGGEGTRLRPLTTQRCKPALMFGGRHRVVDFVLSNLVNSGVQDIYLLAQYRAESLMDHAARHWRPGRQPGDPIVSVVQPQSRHGAGRFNGTADAIYQNLSLLGPHAPDVVAVFGADHVYRMDVRQMVKAHQTAGADVTVATLPVPLAQCRQFGIVDTDASGRITDFKEKPAVAQAMHGRPGHALASMGNYLFSTDVLMAELEKAHARGETDFGSHVLPRLVKSHHLLAYDFSTNEIPGLVPSEERGYWRDVGTIDAYFDAHLDTLGAAPRFSLANPAWPILAGGEGAEAAQIEGGRIRRSSVGAGCVVTDAELDHALLRGGAMVGEDALLQHCLVMDGARIGRGARVRRAIIDQGNHVPPGESIGFDLARDRERFHVTDSGIVVVPSGTFPAPA